MQPFALATTVLLACATQASALDLPARKPGLWEISFAAEGRTIPMQNVQHCIDAATDKQMSALGNSMGREACPQQDVKQSGSTITIDSVCKFGATTTSSHSIVTGDFNSAYTVTVENKHESGPPMPGAKAGETSRMQIGAKWLGPCKAGQKPGDMILGNGIKMNILEMRGMPGAPR